jgi:cytidyltransferase-like protein
MKTSKIVLVTGGFDPLHSGHISYFESAKKLGDKLIVGVNSDAWLERKKGRSFMPVTERTTIIQNLKMVDGVILFNDDDGSATEAIHNVKRLFPDDHIIFANGGDRTDKNIPEMAVQDVEFIFGVGGEDKKNSSSWILEEWKAPKTERQWGYYRVLHEAPGMKVKELTVNPGKSLSMQRHFKRSEYWVVEEGSCNVASEDKIVSLSTHETIDIPVNSWHQLINPFDEPCRIVEIQYGEDCQEEDIERK